MVPNILNATPAQSSTKNPRRGCLLTKSDSKSKGDVLGSKSVLNCRIFRLAVRPVLVVDSSLSEGSGGSCFGEEAVVAVCCRF